MTETILRNARIVTDTEVIEGSLCIRGGIIAEIGGPSALGEDMAGDHIVAGAVELHTDQLENHLHPRPKVRWNLDAAIQAHDAQVATAGITTVFDALRIGHEGDGDTDPASVAEAAARIAEAQAGDWLRAEHFIHLRCEVSLPGVVEEFEAVQANPRVRLASLMDHAPGQRQFVDADTYRIYYQGKRKLSDAAFDAYHQRRIAESEANSDGNRQALAKRCAELGISLASHDDATAAHVAESVALGVALAEFPTTLEAALRSHEAGLGVLMGAPNIVRGGSHSGNLAAADLIAHGALDILSSDYVPASLMIAAAQLAERGAMAFPQAMRLVSVNPAAVAGLTDRGRIALGLRADLVRLRMRSGRPPRVACVWREGQRVA
jgi:alpha-D-ribose 1-methylphosphonate 5-triphosphate diphosphatase